jgi:hypothetical protein
MTRRRILIRCRKPTAEVRFPEEGRLPLGTGSGADSDFCLVKLLFRLGSNLVEFGVKTAHFGVEFYEAQAMRRNQSLSRHSGEVLLTTRFQINAGGRLLCPWIFLQVQKIEICGLHSRIIPRRALTGCEYLLKQHKRNQPTWNITRKSGRTVCLATIGIPVLFQPSKPSMTLIGLPRHRPHSQQ